MLVLQRLLQRSSLRAGEMLVGHAQDPVGLVIQLTKDTKSPPLLQVNSLSGLCRLFWWMLKRFVSLVFAFSGWSTTTWPRYGWQRGAKASRAHCGACATVCDVQMLEENPLAEKEFVIMLVNFLDNRFRTPQRHSAEVGPHPLRPVAAQSRAQY